MAIDESQILNAEQDGARQLLPNFMGSTRSYNYYSPILLQSDKTQVRDWRRLERLRSSEVRSDVQGCGARRKDIP